MTIYIALLRGINVGGKNRIKMAELRRALEMTGLSQVQTYIQSGNVLFESEDDRELLCKRIENEIETVFGFSISVILRTAAELSRIIEDCPFPEAAVLKASASAEGESLYVSLMKDFPKEEGLTRIGAFITESEECRIEGREVYLLFHTSIRNSKLAANLQKLGSPMTIRNWKTINKLFAMAKVMEAG